MTPIEDLLRQTLVDTPTNQSDFPDAAFADRLRRARRRTAISAAVAVAAMTAAVVVPLTTVVRHSTKQVPPTTQTPSPHRSNPADLTPPGPSFDAESVVAAPGQRPWVVVANNGPASSQCAHCPYEFLARLDASGIDSAHYPLPGGVGAVGLTPQLVWLLGGIETESKIAAFDVATHRAVSRTYPGAQFNLAAVTGNDLYVFDRYGDANAGKVIRFGLVGGRIEQRGTVRIAGNPDNVASLLTASDGSLWMQAGAKLIRLSPTSAGIGVAHSFDFAGKTLLGAMPDGAALLVLHGHSIGTLDTREPGAKLRYQVRVPGPGAPGEALATPDGGLYVTVDDSAKTEDKLGIYYYSPSALRTTRPKPTAFLFDQYPSGLTVDPAGGIDFIGYESRLIRWVPPCTAAEGC